MLRITAALAATPAAALVILAATGQLALRPAALAAAATTLAALLLARLWSRDLRTLAHRLHLAGTGAPSPRPPPRALNRAILTEIDHISATLREQSALLDRMLRAEASIVERLPDPLLLLGLDRSVRRANAAARAAFGEDMGAVLRHPELRAAIDRAAAAGPAAAPQWADLRIPVPVAREVQAMVTALDSPLAGGAGILAVLSDRTRERAVERMRADFIANSSHELRTPLASLIGFIATLRGPAADDPPAQARFLAIMAEQAERMSRLIDDLLHLSRVEITEHLPPADQVDMHGVAERILAGFQPALAARHVHIDFRADPALPPVLGDTDQLEQVAANLLDNALKYGRDGGTIALTLAAAPPDPRYPARPGLLLAVKDDGPGIPRQHLPRLTERFYRVDASRSRAVGGTGLGLAIVKHIINRHRGVLLIDSEPGTGATFTIWLPTT